MKFILIFECLICISEAVLRQAPSDRLKIDQILTSEWLEGVQLPGGICEPWSMTPTLKAEDRLTPIERTARERLSNLGITETMLEEELEQGARSAVIATYRIVIHRLQNNAQLPPITPVKPPKSRTCILL